MLGLLDMHWSLLHPNDQISLYCFQAFHCDAIMGQMLYQFQENQRDNFSNDTFRGRSLVSCSCIMKIIKEQSKLNLQIISKVEKYVTQTLELDVVGLDQPIGPQTPYYLRDLYRALLEAYNSDKDPLFSYGKVVTLKRGRDDQDEDKEPFAGLNRTTRSPPKSSGKSVQEEEHDPRVDDLEEPFHQEFDTGNDDVSLVQRGNRCTSRLREYANWGAYQLGAKTQDLGNTTNMETSKDVYSKHRIIAVTSLKIMEFFGYKHLEEITVRRQDDKLYKFREGDFKRLCREDIEDMLLLLSGKADESAECG
ncbi:hypothetical protein Tco_1541641 [Tanacetum coccineum]